jgi:hypothetical protein
MFHSEFFNTQYEKWSFFHVVSRAAVMIFPRFFCRVDVEKLHMPYPVMSEGLKYTIDSAWVLLMRLYDI